MSETKSLPDVMRETRASQELSTPNEIVTFWDSCRFAARVITYHEEISAVSVLPITNPVSTLSLSDADYRRDLGNGLLLRWSTAADIEGLVQLYSYVFRDGPEHPLNHPLAAWTREMMSGEHPLITSGDFALVEDTRRRGIVAGTCLLSQTWEYAGIPFPVGRPEMVASHPDYRNRGLVRAVFELIHARSAARGHLVQGITGIPYYYRQFGYEYALDLGGGRALHLATIPALARDAPEPYRLRDATLQDLPLVRSLYDRERAGALISTRIDERYWRFLLDGVRRDSGEYSRLQLILNAANRPVGYVATSRVRWGTDLGVVGFAVEPGISLIAVLPSVLRALQSQVDSLLAPRPDMPAVQRILFALGRSHRLYDALGEALACRHHAPYAWYVRVANLPAFIGHIAPVLERRLSDSVLAGYTGDLTLDFYRGGLRLRFEHGRFVVAEQWHAQVWGNQGAAGFPPLVFLQLLFGHHSLSELRRAFPDVWAEDEAKPLVEALFPPQPSWVRPLS